MAANEETEENSLMKLRKSLRVYAVRCVQDRFFFFSYLRVFSISVHESRLSSGVRNYRGRLDRSCARRHIYCRWPPHHGSGQRLDHLSHDDDAHEERLEII